MDPEALRQSIREMNRPKMLGGAPSDEAARQGYLFAQAIRSNAQRQGVQYFSLKHFVVAIQGLPRIPRPGTDAMAIILKVSLQYIRRSEATNEAPEEILFVDDEGQITLRKSKEYPYGFSYRFVEPYGDTP